VRILNLGLQVEFERRHDLNIFCAELDKGVLALLGVCPAEKRVENRVNFRAELVDHQN